MIKLCMTSLSKGKTIRRNARDIQNKNTYQGKISLFLYTLARKIYFQQRGTNWKTCLKYKELLTSKHRLVTQSKTP